MAITINGTTGIAGVDGSAGTPAVQGADPNTGIFYPAADTVAIAAGGSNKAQFGTGSATIDGLTVGRGAGAVATNTAIGASALASTSSGLQNTAIGSNAAQYQTNNNNTALGYNAMLGVSGSSAGGSNTAIGSNSLAGLTTGNFNTALGQQALLSNTTASNNTAVGYQAGYSITTGAGNVIFGQGAGYSLTTGTQNTFIGAPRVGVAGCGDAITTGSKNTIIGSYSGNQGGLDIRTSSNYIVLSDGDGNPRSWFGANGAGTNWACAKDDGDITMLYGPANLTPNTTRSARLGFITNSQNKNWYMAHSWLTTGSLEFVQTTANGGSTMGGTAAFSLNSSGNGIFTGSLSKGSGSFRIDHPLPQLEETHHLVHSFIEGPQADLIYRGKVNLVSGRAEVNIDLASGMTEGTFVALCRDVQCFTTNESDWVHVRGSVSGNVLTIEAQDQAATSLISWMVIGERQDKHMIDTDWTDDNGKVIVEPIKPPKIERTERTEVQS